MRIAVLQSDLAPDIATNIARMGELMEEACQTLAPELFILPELWTAPFDHTCPPQGDFPCEGSREALALVQEKCRRSGAHALAGALPWPLPGGSTVRSWLVGDNGELLGHYDKTHLFSNSGESSAFKAGDRPFFFDLAGLRCAVAICYDIRFPEYTRALALAGAEVIFVPAAWPLSRGESWRNLLAAVAQHNQVWVVGVNVCGPIGNLSYSGDSRLITPWGDVGGSIGPERGILLGDVSRAEVEKCRKVLPLLKDRRRELYRLLADI